MFVKSNVAALCLHRLHGGKEIFSLLSYDSTFFFSQALSICCFGLLHSTDKTSIFSHVLASAIQIVSGYKSQDTLITDFSRKQNKGKSHTNPLFYFMNCLQRFRGHETAAAKPPQSWDILTNAAFLVQHINGMNFICSRSLSDKRHSHIYVCY